MGDDENIYVDASQPGTLHDGPVHTDCPTLQEAVIAWHELPLEQKKRASVKMFGGPVYNAGEIERLHYGPKPA